VKRKELYEKVVILELSKEEDESLRKALRIAESMANELQLLELTKAERTNLADSWHKLTDALDDFFDDDGE
jgi:hypothetical protein